MVRELSRALHSGLEEPSLQVVVIKGAGEKAFCAGGDIRALAMAASRGNLDYPHAFFAEEYRLDCLIHRFNKPYVALLDGITMGGGVGISIGASHRVVTEKVSFAMPETGIGFFPDVGGTYFLSRLAGGIGTYLALTGQRIEAKDLIYCGIASHYVLHDSLHLLEAALSTEKITTIDSILQRFCSKIDGEESQLAKNREDIDYCFSNVSTIEAIYSRLQQRGSPWCLSVLKVLKRKSPCSLKVTLRGLLLARNMSLEDTLQQELRMAMRFMQSADFVEGVRAVIIEKDNAPKWKPSAVEDILEEDIASYFQSFSKPAWELWAKREES